MPLYEYECRDCCHRVELLQSWSEAPLETCPECGGEMKKLLSAPAVQFKGSGWYVTDYAGKKASSSDGEKPASGETRAKEGGKGEGETAKASSSSESGGSKAGSGEGGKKAADSSSS